MAGLRGNQAWLASAKQTAKGTPADTSTATVWKVPFSGGNIMPVRETDTLSETDASRDRGQAFVTTGGVEGSPEVYVRDAGIGYFLWAAYGIGSDSVTGATNYVHTLTPQATLPYLTFWRDISDTLYERYEDCMVSGITISAEAGQPLTAALTIQGRKAVRLPYATAGPITTTTTGTTTLPAATINGTAFAAFSATGAVDIGGQVVHYTGKTGTTLTGATGGTGVFPAGTTITQITTEVADLAIDTIESSVVGQSVYNFNEAAVTLGGGATALIRSFELSLENNVSRQQTDDVVPYDIAVGQRELGLSFDMIFETLDEYNKFHYGGATGTAISPTIFETSASFTFTKGANNEVSFTLPRIAYEEFPVEPDPGGDPIVVSVRAVGQRGATPIVTAVVKNQTATY